MEKLVNSVVQPTFTVGLEAELSCPSSFLDLFQSDNGAPFVIKATLQWANGQCV